MKPTTITIAGREATLTLDNRAKFRFQEQGGSIGELFGQQSYLHSIKLLWACLDAEVRAEYASPEDLCDHVGDGDTETWQTLFAAINEVGWLPSAAELKARIAQATAELDQADPDPADPKA